MIRSKPGNYGKIDLGTPTDLNGIVIASNDTNTYRADIRRASNYLQLTADATTGAPTSIGLVIQNGGNVGIGTTAPAYRLELPNIANASGQGRANAWVTYSDISLKENIKPIENALDKILNLQGVTFDWKNQPNTHSSGFIAQQVEQILPELVSTDVNGLKSLDYGRFTPYLVEAIKIQQSQIASLSAQLANFSLTSTGDIQIIKPEKEYVYDGNLNLEYQKSNIKNQKYILKIKNEITDRIGAFAELVAGKIRTALLEAENTIVNNTLLAKNIIAENINLTTENFTIAGKKLADYIDERINQILNSKLLALNSQKIISPIVETTDLTATGTANLTRLETKEIKPQEKDLVINLSTQTPQNNNTGITDQSASSVSQFVDSVSFPKGALARLIIKGLEGKTVTVIDSVGNASFSGQLAANSLKVENNATISGTLAAKEATIEGKLIAEEVQAKNISQLEQSVKSVSSSVESVSFDINEIQRLLAEIKNQPLPDLSNQTNLSNSANLSNQPFNNLTIEQLTVTNLSNLSTLSVSNYASIGNLLIENDKILSLSWELKLSS
ncbi:MAG: tail fiber domain-containing protein, partial [Microgenomates group bacterium]